MKTKKTKKTKRVRATVLDEAVTAAERVDPVFHEDHIAGAVIGLSRSVDELETLGVALKVVANLAGALADAEPGCVNDLGEALTTALEKWFDHHGVSIPEAKAA